MITFTELKEKCEGTVKTNYNFHQNLSPNTNRRGDCMYIVEVWAQQRWASWDKDESMRSISTGTVGRLRQIWDSGGLSRQITTSINICLQIQTEEVIVCTELKEKFERTVKINNHFHQKLSPNCFMNEREGPTTDSNVKWIKFFSLKLKNQFPRELEQVIPNKIRSGFSRFKFYYMMWGMRA